MPDHDTKNSKGPLTASLLISLAIGIGSAGATWGIYSSRLESAERDIAEARRRSDSVEQRNAEQDSKIAVMQAQYAEILRRLSSIERKIDRNQGRESD